METATLGRSSLLKKEWPAYGPLLDFYVAVRTAQEASRPDIYPGFKSAEIHTSDKTAWPDRALIGQSGFPIDIEASSRLFAQLCRIGKTANKHFSAEVQKIEVCLSSHALDLKTLLARGYEGRAVELTAKKAGLDERVLSFLTLNSIRPSIESARNKLAFGFDAATWKQTQCPVCSARPTLNLLQGEPVQRLSYCSQCAFQWPIDRLSCAACGDSDHKTRSYFHDEGDECHRIDVCDSCNHYIKTIDLSELEAADPCLEDLATLHLDVIAVKKGYTRVVPNAWTE